MDEIIYVIKPTDFIRNYQGNIISTTQYVEICVLLGLCSVKKLSVLHAYRNKIYVPSSTVEQSKKTAWLLMT